MSDSEAAGAVTPGNETGLNAQDQAILPSALLLLRAQTGLHPGAGTSVGAIDQPVQRERHTQWPCVQSGSLKGVLREAARQDKMQEDPVQFPSREAADQSEDIKAVFGPAVGQGDYGGALSVTDARILAFPVRCARNLFAWVSCPAVLERLRRDFQLAGLPLPALLARQAVTSLPDDQAAASEATVKNLFVSFTANPALSDPLILEDLLFRRASSAAGVEADGVAQWLEEEVCDAHLRPRERFVLLSDTAFTYLVRYATELTTRIRLNYDTKHVETGALFTLELLPPETLLYSVLLAGDPRGGQTHQTGSEIMKSLATSLDRRKLQIGGEETIGKGWCWVRCFTSPAPAQTTKLSPVQTTGKAGGTA